MVRKTIEMSVRIILLQSGSAACQRASSFGAYNYKVIGQIINNRLDKVDNKTKQITMPLHENIRGANYYK